MLLKNNLPRIFLLDRDGTLVQLDDPNPGLPPESVLNFYCATYPVLTTAKIEGPEIKDDKVVFKFVTTIGTKG